MVHSTYDGFLCTRATIHGKIVKPTVDLKGNIDDSGGSKKSNQRPHAPKKGLTMSPPE